MGRLAQLFIAPGPEDDELATSPSAWHSGRYVTIPMEHWEVILNFASQLDEEKANILRGYAYPENRRVLPAKEESDMMISFIGRLQEAIIEAPPLVPEATEVYLENFPNDEHARMLDAVVAVLSEAQRLGQPFEADADM